MPSSPLTPYSTPDEGYSGFSYLGLEVFANVSFAQQYFSNGSCCEQSQPIEPLGAIQVQNITGDYWLNNY